MTPEKRAKLDRQAAERVVRYARACAAERLAEYRVARAVAVHARAAFLSAKGSWSARLRMEDTLADAVMARAMWLSAAGQKACGRTP